MPPTTDGSDFLGERGKGGGRRQGGEVGRASLEVGRGSVGVVTAEMFM